MRCVGNMRTSRCRLLSCHIVHSIALEDERLFSTGLGSLRWRRSLCAVQLKITRVGSEKANAHMIEL